MTRVSTHVLIAPDKFKGCLTATQVAASVATGISNVAPRIQITRLPIADGGEGTLDAALGAGFERVPVVVSGPTGFRTASYFAIRGTGVTYASGFRKKVPDCQIMYTPQKTHSSHMPRPSET